MNPRRESEKSHMTDSYPASLPQTSDTEGLIGAHELSLLPPGSVLVNVGRGAIVCEDALFNALSGDAQSGLASAGLDCWWKYPTEVANRTCTAPSSVSLSPTSPQHPEI